MSRGGSRSLAAGARTLARARDHHRRFTSFGTGGSTVTYQAWQFQPETYGAKGDGQVVADAVIASGTTLTSASGLFTASDTGKGFVLNGAGAGGAALTGTITYVSPTSVTLSVAVSTSVTAAVFFWATDDGAALKATSVAMLAYALAHGYDAEMILNGIYGASTLYQTTSGPGNYNTHLPVLAPNVNGTTRQLRFRITGPGGNGDLDYWDSVVPSIRPGSVVSMTGAPGTANATFGQQSIIGGPTGGGAFTGGVANTHVETRGVAVYAPAYPNHRGFDFQFLAGWTWDQCAAKTLQAPASNAPKYPDMPGSVAFQSTIGVGLYAPLGGNNDSVAGTRLAAEGYETGCRVGDHFTCLSLATLYVDVGLLIDMTSPLGSSMHAVTVPNWSCEQYNGALRTNGGGYCQVDIMLDAETVAGVDPTYDVSDAANALHGVVRVGDPGRTSKNAIISGASKLAVVNDMLQPGAWSGQPAVPASTVAQQNTAFRDAAVSVKGGTVTVVAVDGVTVATATGVTVMVPAGKNITLTYSVAPTWAWTLL